MNIVVLKGRICNDVELKYTQSNIPVCSFTLAVDRRGKSEDRETDFISMVAWRTTAEFISKYFAKGSAIGIEGSIQTRKYKDKDGNNRTAFEVIVNQAHFMESRKSESNESANTNGFTNIPDDVDLPFN
jgi:single-strand DNA-binding protein